MVKIVNPFRGQDPVAQTLSQLGQNLFGDTAGAAKKKEDLYAAQRTNAETDNLMGMFADGGAFGSLKTGVGQAMALGAGFKGGDMGDYALMDAGLNFGASDARTQNAQVASGQSYDNTAATVGAKLAENARGNDLASSDRRYGVDQSVGQQRYEFDNKPMPALDAAGKPAFATQSGVFDGFSPILSDTEAKGTLAQQNFGTMGDLPTAEQNYIGADSSTGSRSSPKNYVGPDGQRFITYDGVSNAQDGSQLPIGGYIAGVQGGADEALGANGLTLAGTNVDQDTIRAADGYFDMSSQLRGLANTAPESFGLLGSARGTLQELAQMVPAVGTMFVVQNIDAFSQEIIADLGQNPEAQGMLSELLNTYDGNLPTVQTLGVLLQYQVASALLGQSARDLSDKDMVRVNQLFPDPQNWLTSAQAVTQRLDLLDSMMENKRNSARERLNSGSIAPQGGGAPAVVDDGPQEGDTATNPTTGAKVVWRNGSWENI
ncbi:MAG: hypothetical protein JWQ22_128 [Devosia sp.]|nr:hypothetical protein [Devosia sp.]